MARSAYGCVQGLSRLALGALAVARHAPGTENTIRFEFRSYLEVKIINKNLHFECCLGIHGIVANDIDVTGLGPIPIVRVKGCFEPSRSARGCDLRTDERGGASSVTPRFKNLQGRIAFIDIFKHILGNLADL